MSLEDALKAWEQHFNDLQLQDRRQLKKLILDSPEKEPVQQELIPKSSKLVKHFISEPKKKVRLRQQLQEECPVCLNNLDDLESICEIDPCLHQICVDCIKVWAEKYKVQCPCCRAKFKKVWPIKNGKRGQCPLQLDLRMEKWNQEDDIFYQQDDEDCRCQICQCTHTPYLMLICDRCNEQVCHTFCDPALKEFNVPSKKWYCLDCRKSKMIYYKHK